MKYKTPEVTVIIPVFKAHRTLERAINSIRNQTYSNEKIEIIVSVDDGLSYDEFRKADRNIRLLKPPGKIMTGAGQARNRGIKVAKGRLVGFLDADDTWSQNYLKELVPIALRYGVAFAKTEIFNIKGEHVCLLDPGFNIQIKHFGIIPGSFHPLVNRRLAGPFPEGPTQDVIHAIRLLKKIQYRYKPSLNAKYELWLNKGSKTAEKKFSKSVDNSYRKWRYYYLTKSNIKMSYLDLEIIKTLQLKINWNNRYISSGSKESFYEFISKKIKFS